MAIETTPLGFKKPDGNELVNGGDNVIADNAQKAEDRHQEDRGRMSAIEAVNTAQDVRLDGVEANNAAQDGSLASHAARLANLDNAAGFTGDTLELNDEAVAYAVNTGTESHAALDARLTIQVPPIVAAAIATDPTVAESAATMAQSTVGVIPAWKATTAYVAAQRVIAPNGDVVSAKVNFTSGATYSAANWDASTQDGRIGTLETSREVTLTVPGSSTDARTNVGAGLPFKAPFSTSKFRIGFRNRNPKTGAVVAGALSFTAVGIGQSQATGDTLFAGLVEASATTIEGAFATPADGAVHYTPWVTNYALTGGVWYQIRYGYTCAAQTNYAGDGKSFTNAASTSILNKTPAGFAAATTAPLDVWVEAVTDAGSTKQVVYAGQAPTVTATVESITSSRSKISTIGDSLTDGGSNGVLWDEADTWPVKLGTALPGTTVTNLGFTGATVDEILLRTGARPLFIKVTGGSIPASGSVAVTTTMNLGVDAARNMAWVGTLAGLAGSFTRAVDGALTFTRYVSGSAVSAPAELQFIPDWSGHESDTVTIWIGRNDITFGITGPDATIADHVVGGVQELVRWLKPRVKQLMIFGVTTRSNETGASTNGLIVGEINTRLQTLYPTQFKSMQNYLMNQAIADMGLTPTTEDTTNIANGTLPPSVLDTGDNTHISKACATVVATNFVAPYLKAKGWVVQ